MYLSSLFHQGIFCFSFAFSSLVLTFCNLFNEVISPLAYISNPNESVISLNLLYFCSYNVWQFYRLSCSICSALIITSLEIILFLSKRAFKSAIMIATGRTLFHENSDNISFYSSSSELEPIFLLGHLYENIFKGSIFSLILLLHYRIYLIAWLPCDRINRLSKQKIESWRRQIFYRCKAAVSLQSLQHIGSSWELENRFKRRPCKRSLFWRRIFTR